MPVSGHLQHDGDSLKVQRVRSNLRDQVHEAIRKAILDLRFKPGDRLIERELCELMGVSRTSVREALRHLESEGLVRNIPSVGPSVAVVGMSDARDIYELREPLEGMAGRMFVERATAAQMEALVQAFAELETAFASKNMRSMISQTTRFYDVLLDGCGNTLVAMTIRSLQARMVLLRASSMSQPGRVEKSLHEMKEIVDALVKRDAALSAEACMNHVRCARDAALHILSEGCSTAGR